MPAPADPLVLYDKPEPGIAWITLNRPAALNAINMAMRDELWTYVAAAEADPDVRVLCLRGAGPRAFSAGADISEFGSAPSYMEARRARQERDLWARLETSPLITIAVLHGFCFGAGIELPLYCDFRIATEDTVIALPEVGLGYMPSAGGTQTLQRTAPAGAARGLVISGEQIDARRALAWGIVTRVVPSADCETLALALARRLAAGDPVLLAQVKRAIRRGLEMPLAAAVAQDAETARLLRRARVPGGD